MKMVKSELLLETPIFRVTRDVAIDPDGFEITRAIVRHDGSAVVMPVDEKGRVMLVKQYRLPARQSLWELPAGRIDAGETALQAAKRELKEETGLKAKTWTKLSAYWASPGFLEEKMNLFLAEGLIQGEATPMDDERFDRKWFTMKEIGELIDGGKMPDGKTLIGYYRYLDHKKKRSKTAR